MDPKKKVEMSVKQLSDDVIINKAWIDGLPEPVIKYLRQRATCQWLIRYHVPLYCVHTKPAHLRHGIALRLSPTALRERKLLYACWIALDSDQKAMVQAYCAAVPE